MTICSTATNVYLFIFICYYSHAYMLRGKVVTNVARTCDPTPLLLFVAMNYVKLDKLSTWIRLCLLLQNRKYT